MKKGLLVIATLATLFLTGCQNNSQTKNNVSRKTGTGVVRTNKTNKEKKFGSSDESIWNSEKQDKLDDFFFDWADGMDQDYDEYDGSGQIKTAAGEEFPKDFDRVSMNGQKVSLAYEPDGKGNSDYNVVAIYNYDKGEAASHITYFFAFHDNQPIVLVDETTNGDTVQVKETANKDLINGFNAIAAGKDVNTSGNDDSNEENSASEDPKLIGVFVGLLKDGDWFKDNLEDGHMYFGKNAGTGKTKGFYCITTGGTPDSYYWYKQDGDKIIVKYSDTSHGHAVSDGFYKTESYTVDRLKSDYYVNSGQKQEVNGYVNKLKPLEDE